MRWTAQASACVLAAALIGCGGGNRRSSETGTMSDTGGMSAMPADTARSDTGMTPTTSGDTGMKSTAPSGTSVAPSTPTDTSTRSHRSRSSSRANQSESGVTNGRSDSSTLGPGATKTRPDQGQPVTSKGDTINPGVDSSAR